VGESILIVARRKRHPARPGAVSSTRAVRWEPPRGPDATGSYQAKIARPLAGH
jgi:hypothetical protein